jgi:hypothetical protein
LSFEYLGKEAGYTNQFGFAGNPVFTTSGNTLDNPVAGFSVLANVVAGFVNFYFRNVNDGSSVVTNGSVPNDGNPWNFASTLGYFLESDNGSVASWVLLFNDKGGGPDKDFDDMIVRMIATTPKDINPVPIPAALPLLASGLGALGVIGWRKRRKATAAR